MKKRQLYIFLSFLILLGFSACSNPNNTRGDDKAQKLTVLNWTYNSNEFAVDEFKKLHPNIQLEQNLYDEVDSGAVKEKALTEIMSGSGPDVLILRTQLFPNIHKMVQNNVFYNLDSLIKDNSSFKVDEYNQKVMKTGMYDGSQYLIPMYIDFPVMMTTKSFFSKQDIKIPESGISWNELSLMSKKYTNNKKNEGKYMFGTDFDFGKLLYSSYMNYIDYDNKKSNFNSTQFKALLTTFKEIQKSVCPEEIEKKKGTIGTLLDGTIQFIRTPATIDAIQSMSSCLKQYLKEELYLVKSPTEMNEDSLTANVKFLVGINAKCKRPKESFDFLKIILSKSNQTPYQNLNNSRYLGGLPVNTAAFKEELRHYMSNEVSEYGVTRGIGGIKFNSAPLSHNLGLKVEGFYNNISKTEISDYKVYEIVMEESKNFLAGKASAEQIAKAIDQKVSLYLNE